MVFLEFRWDSRVTMGNSGFLLCWPRKSNLPFELPGRAVDWSPFTEGQTRMSPLCSCPLYLRSQRKQLQPLVPRRGQGSQDAQQTEHGRGPHINKRGDKPKSTQQINQTNVSHRVLHKAGASGNRGSYGQRRLAKAESSRYFSRTSQYSNVHGTSLRGIKCSISQIHFFFFNQETLFHSRLLKTDVLWNMLWKTHD